MGEYLKYLISVLALCLLKGVHQKLDQALPSFIMAVNVHFCFEVHKSASIHHKISF